MNIIKALSKKKIIYIIILIVIIFFIKILYRIEDILLKGKVLLYRNNDIVRKKFYVCSYGGSGSKMLCKALSNYGVAYHIHSRKPPIKLEYIGKEMGGNVYHEWFNGISIPEDKLIKYKVIYIYRNPVKSILSRFRIPKHLHNIQCDSINIKLDDILSSRKDLYKIEEFYNNYMKPNNKRNYKIYCVKYEDIFDKQDELSEILGIGKLNLVNTINHNNSNNKLNEIYSDLINEMKNNNFITIN